MLHGLVTGNCWELDCVRDLAQYAFAYNRHNYAKYLTLLLAELLNLETSYPEVHQELNFLVQLPETNPFGRCKSDKVIDITIKGATKSYFTHYSGVVIILFKLVYVGLHFLPILLILSFSSSSAFCVFLFRVKCFESRFEHVLSLFKKVLCNFLLFIKSHQTIYKNYIA